MLVKLKLKQLLPQKVKLVLVQLYNSLFRQNPVIQVIYSYGLITSYVAKTAFNTESIYYLQTFLGLQSQAQLQVNKKNQKLVAIDRKIDTNLSGASRAYIDFVEKNPDYIEGYFKTANVLYLQGRYAEAIDRFYAKGLSLLEEKNKSLGLDLLNTRFVTERNWGFNIGHLSCLDILIKLNRLGFLSQERRVVYARKKAVSNPCYLDYWSKQIDVIYLNDEDYFHFINFTGKANEHISCPKLDKGFTNLYSAWNLAEQTWRNKKLSPLLKLEAHDRERGFQVLEQLKIPSDAWFVALHVREGDSRITRSNSNAKIETYFKAIQSITDLGGYVIRMGHPGMTPLPTIERVVDYANSKYKSDWMDVFLWASCRFFIGTSSGPLTVPPTFGRPILYTNCPAIGINPYFPRSLMLPKLYYSNTENRFFSFREMLDSSMGWTVSSVFEEIDCTIVDNTPDEIDAAVIEMLEADGLPDTHELSELQTQFNALRSQYGDTGQITISQSFVQKHSSLL